MGIIITYHNVWKIFELFCKKISLNCHKLGDGKVSQNQSYFEKLIKFDGTVKKNV